MARKKRIPQLKHSVVQNIGWHVSYRDPATGMPRRHRFGMVTKAKAEEAYYQWLGEFVKGKPPKRDRRPPRRAGGGETKRAAVAAEIVPGSLLHVASSYLRYEESRAREDGEARRQGSISRTLFKERTQYSKEFLEFLNTRHGDGAVRRMQLADLAMDDVEAYNRMLVDAGYSASLVSKRLQFVHSIIKRAGRPEHGGQVLGWNWDARDVLHGKRTEVRKLPSLPQLKQVLQKCSVRETAMVWLAIGCGFGQRDLAVIRVGQMNRKHYDLRRGKTGIKRYGETPPMVWNALTAYLNNTARKDKELLFVTHKGQPLVHGNTDSVAQWWKKLRSDLGKGGKSLSGFYILRHLGATEFGSRPGCSIGDVKRWLGHSASSQVADVYMKPVSPEDRAVVEWVRKCLQSGRADVQPDKGKKKKESQAEVAVS